MAQSERLGLSLLVPGQGQKDVTHNEALLALDMLVQPVVRSRAVVQPPETASNGQCWLVPEGAEGAWNGKTHCLAGWTAGGWRFLPTETGWSFWVEDEGTAVRRRGNAWEQIRELGQPGAAIEIPFGGSVADAEARVAIAALIGRLIAQGVLES